MPGSHLELAVLFQLCAPVFPLRYLQIHLVRRHCSVFCWRVPEREVCALDHIFHLGAKSCPLLENTSREHNRWSQACRVSWWATYYVRRWKRWPVSSIPLLLAVRAHL